jgi:hypothetical protein
MRLPEEKSLLLSMGSQTCSVSASLGREWNCNSLRTWDEEQGFGPCVHLAKRDPL